MRNVYAGQEAAVRIRHGTTDWFQIGKGVHQGCMLSPCLFNLYAEYIMRDAKLDEAQVVIKIGEISITSDMQMISPLWQKVKRKIEEMTSSPISSWQIGGKPVETVRDFIFLGLKITADGDCSNEIKRHILLRRNVMTNIDNILKSRDITLLTKVYLVKAITFSVVMYGYEI